MNRKNCVSVALDNRFNELTHVQNSFWRDTFPKFVKPLRDAYQDPAYSGTQILGRFLSSPETLFDDLTTDPALFGPLTSSDHVRGEVLSTQLVSGASGVSLLSCAKAFERVRAASAELDRIRCEHPHAFEILRRRRRAYFGRAGAS
jgi:hypothetical protein